MTPYCVLHMIPFSDLDPEMLLPVAINTIRPNDFVVLFDENSDWFAESVTEARFRQPYCNEFLGISLAYSEEGEEVLISTGHAPELHVYAVEEYD